MPNMQERLDAAVNKAEVDTGLLHNIVHGSIKTEIDTEGGKVPSVAKVLNDMRVLMEADEAILYLIANGDQTTVVHTKNGDVPSAAKTIKDIKDSIISGTNNLVEQAQTAATTATEQANKSANAALRALEAENNGKQSAKEAKIWAEGSDEEIAVLGGEHSAREWVELAERATRGSFPTTVFGVASANQTILSLPETLNETEQILSVNVENSSLMPDTYTLSNDGKSVALKYPLTENERWSVKYLTDFQSMNVALDNVLYEDM